MDLTTYGLVVVAFSEKVKAEEVLTSDMCDFDAFRWVPFVTVKLWGR